MAMNQFIKGAQNVFGALSQAGLSPQQAAEIKMRQQQAAAAQAYQQQQLAQRQAEFQAEQKYRDWQMSSENPENQYKAAQAKAYSSGMPVFTIDPLSGGVTPVGSVPKGSKVITPSSMYSPEQKADIQVSTAARKDEGVRNQKLKGLMGTIDFFEQKIGEIPAGLGFAGRVKGAKTAIEGMLQTNPDAAAYMASVEGMRSQIARGLGEVGNLSEYEQKYAVRLLPGITDNLETRKKKIQNFKDYIQKKIGGVSGPQITPDLQNAIQASGIKGNIKAIRLKGSK